jgi:hypothetical protein
MPGPVRSQATIAAISTSDDVHDPCRIVGQDQESHFGGNFWKRLGEEACHAHANFRRAERVLDRLSTLAHGSSFVRLYRKADYC